MDKLVIAMYRLRPIQRCELQLKVYDVPVVVIIIISITVTVILRITMR